MFNVYYRASLTEAEEIAAMEKHEFRSYHSLGSLSYNHRMGYTGNLVIPRYSVLPYAQDMFREFEIAGLTSINTLEQFLYTADIEQWYEDLEGLTFRTWFDISRLPDVFAPEHGYVLKGETNSKKHLWNTHMRAANKTEAIQVMCRLQDDSLVGTQKIVAREYVPLVTYLEGPQGIPISNEWRCFCLGRKVLATGYYWHNYTDTSGRYVYTGDAIDIEPVFTQDAAKVVDEACRILGEKHGDLFFYVLDVAQTVDHGWKIVELNSGEMSGLACVDPGQLYYSLNRELMKKALVQHKWR